MPEVIYPLASTTWDSEEVRAATRLLESNQLTMGTEVRKFEEDFAKYIGTKYAVMFNSGSSANLGMLAALRYVRNSPVQEGDEVIVPAVSWSTTYYPVNQVGLTLKFVDVNLQTLNIEVNLVEQAIGPKTKAILAVNLLGNPAELNLLRKLSEKHNLVLLEDNCESLGRWPVWVDKNSHLIDSSSYCFSQSFIRMVGHIWDFGWGGDRRFYTIVKDQINHKNYGCTGKHTLNYRLGGNEGSVQADFFIVGNEKTLEHFNNKLPWLEQLK